MPLFSAAGVAIAGALFGGSALAATIIGTVLAAGTLYAVAKIFGPDIPARPETRRTGPPIAIDAARWVLGRARTAGSRKFFQVAHSPQSSGKNNMRDMWLAHAISEGVCSGIEKIWVDGDEVNFTRSGNKLTVTTWKDFPDRSPQFNSNDVERLAIYEYFAADGNQGDEIRAACSEWTDDHRFIGISWVAIRLFQPRYGGDTIPDPFWRRVPEIQFLVKGIHISWLGQPSPTWTENAAALRYWLETERKGIPSEVIDPMSFAAAFRTCNAPVNFSDVPAQYADFTTSLANRYSINGIATSEHRIEDLQYEMDFAWQGNIAEAGGVLHFNAGADRTVRFNLDETDTVSMGPIQTAPALQDRLNALSMSILQSRDHKYLPAKIPVVEDTDAFDRDGEYYLPLDIGQRMFIDGPIRAAWMTYIGLREARGSMRIPVTLRPGTSDAPFAYLGILPGNWVTYSNAEHGLSSTLFQVAARTVHEDMTVSLQLEEQFRGNFAENLILPPLLPRDINIGEQFVPEVEGFELDEIAETQDDGTVLVTLYAMWTSSAFQTQVQARLKAMPEASLQDVTVDRVQQVGFPGVLAGQVYEVRARHINRFEVVGEWTEWVEREIGGDLMPPALIEDFTLMPLPGGYIARWTPARESDDPMVQKINEDYLHTEIWQNSENNFMEATRIAEVDASEWQQYGFRESELVHVWARHVDTSKNLGGRAYGTVETGIHPVDYDDPSGQYSKRYQGVVCYYEGDFQVTADWKTIPLLNRLNSKTLEVDIASGGIHSTSSFCDAADISTSASSPTNLGFAWRNGTAQLQTYANSEKTALFVRRSGGSNFNIKCIIGLRSELDRPERRREFRVDRQCGSGIALGNGDISVTFPSPVDILGSAFGGGLISTLGSMTLGRGGLGLNFGDSFRSDVLSSICVDVFIAGQKFTVLGAGGGGLPGPFGLGRYLLSGLAGFASFLAGWRPGVEICVSLKGSVPEPLEPPTLTITDIETVGEKETATFEAMLEGGRYDSVDYLWEIIEGDGTLSAPQE